MNRFTLPEIEKRLRQNDLPFSGITPLGSAEFHFEKPAICMAAAIHAGNRVREDILKKMAVSGKDRYREEDPHTERFARAFPIRIIARDSRFEYDINRKEDTAVYQSPEMAWGLDVLHTPLTESEISDSLEKYREFHALMDLAVAFILHRFPVGIVFDFHSYNYQRDTRLPWYENEKPAINLGTGPVNSARFRPVIDHFLSGLEKIKADGRGVPVGENVVFKGGFLSRRLCATHPDELIVFAVEFKKIFMDEWTGELREPVLASLTAQMNRAAGEVTEYAKNSY